MKKYEPNEDKGQALFNAGLAKLERIHKLKVVAHHARLHNDWEAFYFSLCGVHSEIYERMNKQEKAMADKMQKSIITECLEYNKKNKAKRFYQIFEYEALLNYIESKYGMSMPDKPDQSEAGDI